jgi:hypothetical protein
VLREREATLQDAATAGEAQRLAAEETARLLAAYQARDTLITYRLATQAHEIVRRRPWLRGALKLAARSALRFRAQLSRSRQT